MHTQRATLNRRLDRIIHIEKAVFDFELPRNVFAQRLYAIALGSMMSGSYEGNAGFVGDMHILL